MRKRTKVELYADILEAIRQDIAQNLGARMTRVYNRISMPYDRFKIYIDDLSKNGLINIEEKEGHNEIVLTDRGFQYLKEYEQVKNFLIAFGLQRADEETAGIAEKNSEEGVQEKESPK